MATVVISFVLVVLAGLAIRSMIRTKKKGTGCGCGCDSCHGCSHK